VQLKSSSNVSRTNFPTVVHGGCPEIFGNDVRSTMVERTRMSTLLSRGKPFQRHLDMHVGGALGLKFSKIFSQTIVSQFPAVA
jgi:hypothetical protein